jgi:hypothetical protein
MRALRAFSDPNRRDKHQKRQRAQRRDRHDQAQSHRLQIGARRRRQASCSAIGLVANQLATESTVAVANDGTDRLQLVAESTLAAHLNMRQVQLAARGIRLARSPSDIDKAVAEMREASAVEAREIDVALTTARSAETKERLQKIKSLMASYSAGIEELAKAQRDLLAQVDKRRKYRSNGPRPSLPKWLRRRWPSWIIAPRSRSCCCRPTSR